MLLSKQLPNRPQRIKKNTTYEREKGLVFDNEYFLFEVSVVTN